MALDYDTYFGIATSVGHAPATALIDPAAGSICAITEALTNIVWAPLTNGLSSISSVSYTHLDVYKRQMY